MRYLNFCLIIWTIVTVVYSIGCSSRNSPSKLISPDLNIPFAENPQDMTNHQLLGTYTFIFDVENLRASVEPNRELSAHFNVTSYLPSPSVEVISYNPSTNIIEAKVTLRNPYSVNAYDPRLIIYTDNIGHMLINADDWTNLYDIAGGININPFKAYAKREPNRVFASNSSHSEVLLVLLPSGNPVVKFAIDVSYPSNCLEPYSIYNFQHTPLYDEYNASASAEVKIRRWNESSTATVELECPAILGSNSVLFNTNDNRYFYGTITNIKSAPIGEYWGILKAKTNLSSLCLYDVITIVVTSKPDAGWAVSLPDDRLNGLELDKSGNPYLCVSVKPDIYKYDKKGSLIWMRDLNADDSYNEGFDIHYNPFDDYIRIAGSFAYCGTRTDTGLMAGLYSRDNQRIRVYNQCLRYTSQCTDVAADKNRNTYLTGNYAVYSVPEAVMAKIDFSGNPIWTIDFNHPQGGIAFKEIEYNDSFETIYGIGVFNGTFVDFAPPSGTRTVYLKGKQDAFLGKWDANGNCRSVLSWGDAYGSRYASVTVNDIAFDYYNNIFVIGDFTSQVDFDPSSSVAVRTSYGGRDIYVSKFDALGNLIKNIRVGGAGISQFGNSIAIDLNGFVYITGGFDEVVDFDPDYNVEDRMSNGSLDIYLAKYNNNLEFVWVRTWGNTGSDVGLDVECDPISNNVLLSGTFQGTIDFDPADGVYNLTADSAGDVFLMKLRPNGYW